MESSVPLNVDMKASLVTRNSLSQFTLLIVPDIYGYVTNRPQILPLEATIYWFL